MVLLPKGVPNSVLEGDKVLIILSHEVPRVEVGIPFHKHVSQNLLLGQLFAASIAEERTLGVYFGQQQSRFT